MAAFCAFKRSPESFDPLARTSLNSRTFPDPLIEQAMPLAIGLGPMAQSAMSRWNGSLVYWLPWSELCSNSRGRPLHQIAIIRVSVTIRAVVVKLGADVVLAEDGLMVVAASLVKVVGGRELYGKPDPELKDALFDIARQLGGLAERQGRTRTVLGRGRFEKIFPKLRKGRVQ